MKESGMTDPWVLISLGYSPKSSNILWEWKRKHNLIVPRASVLQRAEITELAKTHSYRAIARLKGVHWKTFYNWLVKQRDQGYYI
jgi:hypothetical protein